MDWMKDALCREIGGELFFSEESNAWMAAKKVCSLCDVRYECLEYALTMNVEGIWGGTSPKERAKIKRQRRVAA